MKALLSALVLLVSGAASAEKSYHTLLMNGQRVGYATSEEKTATLGGRPALRTDVHMDGRLSMAGTPFRSITDTVTWTTPDGLLLRKTGTNVMGGIRLRTDAVLGEKTAEIDVEDAGKKSHLSVPLPDGPVYGDPLWAVRHRLAPGGSLTFWRLYPNNGYFERVELKALAPEKGVQVAELKGETSVERYSTGPKGELLRWEMPQNMTMVAATKAAALAPVDEPTEATDLVVASALKADRPIENAAELRQLKLRFTGMDLSKAPSDEAQIVTRDGDGWTVLIGPPAFQIAYNSPPPDAAPQDAYLKPERYLSSDDPAIRRVAEKLTKDVGFTGAVRAIRGYVGEKMTYEIGFGGTRDAKEILKRPKGKCTDYAILTVALLRASGIPARIASGLVTVNGTFYYHAWAEAWDGVHWFGVDSTAPWESFPASYVKLAQGNVEEGFRTIYPEDPKAVEIKVLSPKR